MNGKNMCYVCEGEIGWGEPMIVEKNTSYCLVCYEEKEDEYCVHSNRR